MLLRMHRFDSLFYLLLAGQNKYLQRWAQWSRYWGTDIFAAKQEVFQSVSLDSFCHRAHGKDAVLQQTDFETVFDSVPPECLRTPLD